MINKLLAKITDYPFAQLSKLLNYQSSSLDINLYIGNPIKAISPVVGEIMHKYAKDLNQYPTVEGITELRTAISNFLKRRYTIPKLSLNEDNILPVCGSKEALFNIACLENIFAENITSHKNPKNLFLMPNPFYQVYKASCLLNGGTPYYLEANVSNNYQPDISLLSQEILEQTKLAFICNPSNPQGSIISIELLKKSIETARYYGFQLVFDECYNDLYYYEKPYSALDATNLLDGTLKNIIITNTLSKRSSAAGLRSGFLLGDTEIIKEFIKLRSYTSPVMPIPIMHASTFLWNDDTHVAETRSFYNYNIALTTKYFKGYTGYREPQAAFYVWLKVKNALEFTKNLYLAEKIRVLPGAFLTEANEFGENHAHDYIRIALVYEPYIMEEALIKIRKHLENY